MRITTKFVGEIDIDYRQRVFFTRGLFGFEHCTDFVLFDAEQAPFYYFQALNDKDVCFILLDPFLFRPDYEADITQEEMDFIGIREPEQAALFVIVTIPANGGPITANLQGPLVINKKTKQGCQVVLTDPRWKTKHDIIAELHTGIRREDK